MYGVVWHCVAFISPLFLFYIFDIYLYVLHMHTQHCRQPMSFLSLFHHPHNEGHVAAAASASAADGTAAVNVASLPAGVYVVPTFCEYCGANHVQQCDPDQCPRPALYFQKKRPPFCKPDSTKWDPVTDHAIVHVLPTPSSSLNNAAVGDAKQQEEEGNGDNDVATTTTTSAREAGTPVSFLSGLFGGSGQSDT